MSDKNGEFICDKTILSEMADKWSAKHMKPDGSLGAFNKQQIFWTASEGMGQNMHNILQRVKPFEDLRSIETSATGLNRF